MSQEKDMASAMSFFVRSLTCCRSKVTFFVNAEQSESRGATKLKHGAE
jgi:transposase-like protein